VIRNSLNALPEMSKDAVSKQAHKIHLLLTVIDLYPSLPMDCPLFYNHELVFIVALTGGAFQCQLTRKAIDGVRYQTTSSDHHESISN
jgi:hypothetical protein